MEERFAAFQASRLVPPRQYGDWRAWLGSKRFYGEISNAEIEAMAHPEGEIRMGDYLSGLVRQIYLGPAKSDYDPLSKTWTLRVMQCSENYLDFILILSVLRAVASYKDLHGDDFILIYPYLWGGAP